jgi:hypothetical protein
MSSEAPERCYKRQVAQVQLKSGSSGGPLGEVSALVATLGVVDLDGDYATAASFTDGQEVIISPWNHGSVAHSQLPVGKGQLRVDSSRVTVEAQYFLMTAAGREAFQVVKEMGPAQEWSYGYRVLDQGPIYIDGEQVNHLKQVHVFEASPVWMGAGIATRTLSAKEATLREYLRFIKNCWGLDPVPAAARTAQADLIHEQMRHERARFLSMLTT